MMPVNVTLAGDWNTHLLPMGPFTLHELVPALGPPGPPMWLCTEFPTTILCPIGFALGQNKLTRTVLHQMQPIALDGHDCGYMLLHLTLWPAFNVKDPIATLFSSRKMVFSASTVWLQGAPTACTQMLALPMLTCAKPLAVPGSYAFNASHTLVVGMTPQDVIAGVLGILLTLVCDLFLSKRSQLIGKDRKLGSALKGGGSLRNIVNSLLKDTVKKLFPTEKKAWVEFVCKSALAIATGGIRMALTPYGKVSLQLGTPYIGVTAAGENKANEKRSMKLSAQYPSAHGERQDNVEISRKAASENADVKTSQQHTTFTHQKTVEPGKITETDYPAFGSTPTTTVYSKKTDGSWQRSGSTSEPPQSVPDPSWGRPLVGSPVHP